MHTPHKLNRSDIHASILLASSSIADKSQKSIHLQYIDGEISFKVYLGYTPFTYSTVFEAVDAYNGYDETQGAA